MKRVILQCCGIILMLAFVMGISMNLVYGDPFSHWLYGLPLFAQPLAVIGLIVVGLLLFGGGVLILVSIMDTEGDYL